MKLSEIWNNRTDTRLVAYRPGTLVYVPLGYKTLAYALECVGLSAEDAAAEDFVIGEVISGPTGQAIGFKERS